MSRDSRNRRFCRHVVVAAALLSAAASGVHADDFVFTSPAAGSNYHVGDVMRIEFVPTDTSKHTYRDAMRYSPDLGLTWKSFAFMNGEDTITLTRHFDWTIPADILGFEVPGDSCLIGIFLYEPSRERARSAAFTIRAAVSVSSVRFAEDARQAARAILCAAPAGPWSMQPLLSVDGRVRAPLSVPGHAGGASTVVLKIDRSTR